jgi:hypothetical protein
VGEDVLGWDGDSGATEGGDRIPIAVGSPLLGARSEAGLGLDDRFGTDVEGRRDAGFGVGAAHGSVGCCGGSVELLLGA